MVRALQFTMAMATATSTVAAVQKSPTMAFRVENAKASDAADLYIYDVIGDPWGDGVIASDFVKEVNAITAPRINVHISSPGGYVSDALAMYNALKMHKAKVVAYVESEAASAASFVAMACDEILIAKNAQFMIHDAQGMARGPASTMRQLADMLDEESENIASIYAERTDKTTAHWREAMRANNEVGTFYRGQKAIDAGLADGFIPTNVKTTPSIENILVTQHDPKPADDVDSDLEPQPKEPVVEPEIEEEDDTPTTSLAEAIKPIRTRSVFGNVLEPSRPSPVPQDEDDDDEDAHEDLATAIQASRYKPVQLPPPVYQYGGAIKAGVASAIPVGG